MVERFVGTRRAVAALAMGVVLFGAAGARAQLPTAKELVAQLGISDSDVEKALGGGFVELSIEPSNPRELTAGFAFVVRGMSPTELVGMLRKDTADAVDENVKAHATIDGPADAADFAKLQLRPDPKKRAAEFADAEPGSDLNLSVQEIASFDALAKSDVAAVQAAVRSMLVARTQAYQQKGLAGIAPYARADGDTRSAADDLRSATKAGTLLEKYLPSAYALMLDYPAGKPADIQERFRWSQIDAHGEPTIVLTHAFSLPDGPGWISVQRQFYVSTGYNCEQALAAFLPVSEGTAVFYANRTSTDQVTGFGGSAKRSIGSKLLASQLKGLFEKVRAKAGTGGG